MVLAPLFRACLLVLLLATLSACASLSKGPPPVAHSDVTQLALAIRALGPDISVEEADRAAHIAFHHPLTLAEQYQITDPPIIHNMKVNQGLRPRGLCWHWAEDMQKRLAAEGFETLELHRAIAVPTNPFRLEHSTVIVSRRGEDMFQGIVLDPWRYGGELFWSATTRDDSYDWQPQRVVLEERRRARLEREAGGADRGGLRARHAGS